LRRSEGTNEAVKIPRLASATPLAIVLLYFSPTQRAMAIIATVLVRNED